MTNADRIRKMTDEELTKIITGIIGIGSDAGSSDQYGDDQRSTCRKCEGL